MEAEGVPLAFRARLPGGARRLQQHKGAVDVGLDEGARPVYGAVDVALGGQVHDHVGCEGREQGADGPGIADVDLLEGEPRVVGDGCEVVAIAGIGQLVQHADAMVARLDQMAHDRRSDKAGPAGHDELAHADAPMRNGD